MRMRFKPYARPELLACDFHVHERWPTAATGMSLRPATSRGIFELGCGKGGFLARSPRPTRTSTI